MFKIISQVKSKSVIKSENNTILGLLSNQVTTLLVHSESFKEKICHLGRLTCYIIYVSIYGKSKCYKLSGANLFLGGFKRCNFSLLIALSCFAFKCKILMITSHEPRFDTSSTISVIVTSDFKLDLGRLKLETWPTSIN